VLIVTAAQVRLNREFPGGVGATLSAGDQKSPIRESPRPAAWWTLEQAVRISGFGAVATGPPSEEAVRNLPLARVGFPSLEHRPLSGWGKSDRSPTL